MTEEKQEEKISKKRKVLIGVFIFVMLLLSVWGGSALLYKSHVKEATDGRVGMQKYMDSLGETKRPLNEVCEGLSEETGKSYEPVIGTYVEKKSPLSIVESTASLPEYSHTITLKNGSKETKSYSQKMSEDQFYKKYKKVLEEVVFVNINKGDDEYIYGICAYKDEMDKYRHSIDTLSLTSGGQ